MRKILIVLLLGVFSVSISAQTNAERITLKNGSVLSGYICSQIPGQDMIFKSYISEIYISDPDSYILKPYEMKVSELPDAWKKWVNENPQSVNRIGDTESVTMYDILRKETDPSYQPSTVNMNDIQNLQCVRILEKGHILKCLDLKDTDYSVPASDIRLISRTTRGREILSGIIDVIETLDGKVIEGQIISQIPGDKISLATQDGLIEVIASEDIAKQKRKPLSKSQGIIEQSQFKDIIVTENGSYTGIIIEQNFVDNPMFCILQDSEGKKHKVDLISVKALKKEINQDYKLIRDIILADNEFSINGHSANIVTYKPEVSQTDGDIVVVSFKREDIVELNLSEINNQLNLRFKKRENNDFSLIMWESMNTKFKRKNTEFDMPFSYKQLVESTKSVKRAISPNNMVELTFEVSTSGYYLLYNSRDKIGLVVYIK